VQSSSLFIEPSIREIDYLKIASAIAYPHAASTSSSSTGDPASPLLPYRQQQMVMIFPMETSASCSSACPQRVDSMENQMETAQSNISV
jgi:hypothetical protein